MYRRKHSLYGVLGYLQFQASGGGLGTYPVQVYITIIYILGFDQEDLLCIECGCESKTGVSHGGPHMLGPEHMSEWKRHLFKEAT